VKRPSGDAGRALWRAKHTPRRRTTTTKAAGTNKERSVAAMITISVEIRTGCSTRTIKVNAPSVRRALELAAEGSPGAQAGVLFPIDPDEFFAGPKDVPDLLDAPVNSAGAS
jgi:hypothetical protein